MKYKAMAADTNNQQLLLEVLRQLIAIDTTNPPGNEHAAAEYLAGLLSGWGVGTRLQKVGENRSNLIATLHFGPGPTVALCGHLDVVAADRSKWDTEPFSLYQQGSRVYGRGVCDMKGAVAAMAVVAGRLAQNPDQLSGTLELVFVADEELYTTGTLAYLQAGNRPDMAVIGEPTDMDVCVAHRGVIRYTLEFSGVAGHASAPGQAQNPITDAARFAVEAERYNNKLRGFTHPILPPPTLAVTVISGGEQTNSIPATCRVTVDRRTLPGEDRSTIQAEIEEICKLAAVTRQPEITFFVEVAASEQLPGSELAERSRQVLEQMGISARIRDFGACCDQFAFIGAGVDCLLVGPGSLEQAHTSNELIELSQLALAERFYLRFVRTMLGAPCRAEQQEEK